MPRGKYKLNAEDAALFRRAAGPVKPLHHDKVQRRRGVPSPYPRFRRHDEEQVMRDLLSDEYDPTVMETGEELSFARPGLQRLLLRRLQRGQFSVGAELDLHGMTVPLARLALTQFVRDCRAAGIRCVRVIHGKGYRSRHQGPVLKNKVNSWLRQWDEVLAFCSARPADGGTGALYVLLKRG